MSQSMFEIRRVFQQNRIEISKVNEGFPQSIANSVKEYGSDQIIDNLTNMLAKELGRGCQRSQDKNLQHNSMDYLAPDLNRSITPALREEAVLSILQFAVQTNCLDQTVMQAVHLADNYLRYNKSVQPAFMRIIYAMALEISIKMNEQMVLSLDDIESLFENRFNNKMLVNLERHILTLNNFRINVATPLDFVINLVFMGRDILCSGTYQLEPEQIVNETLPVLHYALSNYSLSTKRYSSIAVAAICHFLQEAHEDFQVTQAQQNGPDNETFSPSNVCEMQQIRDSFLTEVFLRFPEFDQAQIYEILTQYKEPYLQLASQSQEDVQVKEPWTFWRLQSSMNITDTIRRSNAHVHGLNLPEPVPDLNRLSLQGNEEQHASSRQVKIHETDCEQPFSTADTSMQGTGREGRDGRHNLAMASQSSMSAHEENKSMAAGEDLSIRDHYARPQMIPSEYPPPELGRPSLSESTAGAPSKQLSQHSSYQRDGQMRSSRTHMQRMQGDTGVDLLLDENQQKAGQGFQPDTFHGGGSDDQEAGGGKVDGLFQVIGQDDDEGLGMEDVKDSSDSEDDLTYNSQGKPVPKVTKASGDRKQRGKMIAKPAKPKRAAKPGETKLQKQSTLM